MAGLNNWLDAVSTGHGIAVAAYDSMFYDIFDDFQLTLTGAPGGGSGSDQLVLSDEIATRLSLALSFGDTLSFADAFVSNFLSATR
jgi:hypothetical protein